MSTHSLELERKYRRIFGVRRKGKDFGYMPRRKSAEQAETAGGIGDVPKPPDTTFELDDEGLSPADMTNSNGNGDDDKGAPMMLGESTRHLSELATLLSQASGNEVSRAQALTWLLHTQPGRTMAARTSRLHKTEQTMPKTREQELSAIAKQYGAVKIAKALNAGPVFMSEAEFTQCLVEDCQRHPERGSFAKRFSDQGPEGIELRKAVQACRDHGWAKAGTPLRPLMPIMPMVAGGDDINNAEPAIDALRRMAERMKASAAGATKSAEQCFVAVYTDPANRELAARERRESRAALPTVGGRLPGL
jgi:hypothetical protein